MGACSYIGYAWAPKKLYWEPLHALGISYIPGLGNPVPQHKNPLRIISLNPKP